MMGSLKRGIVLLVVLILSLSALVIADIFEDKNESDFSGGAFNNTFYNSSGFVQLNNSVNVSSNGSEMAGNETGLIAYWRLNESSWSGISGEVKDVIGRNNGTAKNGANTIPGVFGNAGNFSGASGSYVNEVQIANREELNPALNSFTITGWAKSITRGGNGYQLYVAKRDNISGGKNGYYVGLLEGSGIKFVVGNGTNRVDTSYVNIDYTRWFHFAAVINRTSNQSLIYINGTLGASANITSVGKINNSWNLSIGNDEGQALLGATYQYPVKGQIDEVAFWSRALDSGEIVALYQKGIANSSSNFINISSGTYESIVKDAGSLVNWTSLSWNSEGSDSIGKANVLLMYLEGNANDENGINNGSVSGASSVSGKNGGGYYFDGVDDRIEVLDSTSLDLISDFSVGAWVNFTSLPPVGEWQGIVTKGGTGETSSLNHNFFLSFDNDMAWGSGVGITWGYENSTGANYQTRYQWTPTLGQWYHIAGVFNDSSNEMILYINGNNVSQINSATGVPNNQNQQVYIGRNQAGSSGIYYLNAVIDEVFISNSSLSSVDIQEIYNSADYSSLSEDSNLNFKIRTSNDNISWSEYTGSDGTSNSYYNSPGELNLENSQYLQYKAYFSDSASRLYNISIGYENIINITVSLDSPADNYLTNEYNLNVTCSASSAAELSNVTVYYSKFGWAPSEPPREVSGISNTTTFTLNEIASTVNWNCYFCNIDGECSFADSNRTIIGDILSPEISLVSPSNGYSESSTQTLNFIFNASDNRASILNCTLLIENIELISNFSVVSGIDTTISSAFSNANYSWRINCSDGVNYALSEERNFSVNFSIPYTPFWAKANTHTHTTNSDGDSSPITVVNLYKNLEYNILAITDHGYITNCTPFTNLSANFLCVDSEEWTSTKHVVRINVNSAYNNAAVNLQNATNAAVNGGGFAIAAHPNWSSTIWTVSDLTSLQNYTAMEIYNKVIERLSPDPYAVDKWDSVLKTGKKIFGVASDDMHQVNVDLGYGFTKVYMPEFTKQAYVDSMKTGYFYASQGPGMDSVPFGLTCDSAESYHMGESANCSSIDVNATISATNSSYRVMNISLIKEGSVIDLKTDCSVSQNCSYNYSENVSSSGYYRLEATDSRNKRVWSNPIWVNKIALPVTITVHSPENNSAIMDYTPFFNVSLNQKTSLWYNLNGNNNLTLCDNCSNFTGYIALAEGDNVLYVYSNNSDNIIRENKVFVSLDFNNSLSEDFLDNSSINFSTTNVSWSNGKVSFAAGSNSTYRFGNFILFPIATSHNITGFNIEWSENNTENAKGDGQRAPIILKYRLGNDSWVSFNSDGSYIINGSNVSGLNGNNLSLMFDFEKNNNTPIDLLSFSLTWTEFTVPMISNVSVSSVTSNSATILWNSDLASNSTVLYGISSSLGSSLSVNDSVVNHSVSLQGLNPSTGYFYRVVSCTDSSCSQDPQSPFPPYSLTTQSVQGPSSGGSSGSSGSSGGGGYIPVNTAGLELSDIAEIVAKQGDKKTLSISAKNTGKIFLNHCRLIARGEVSSWVYSNQVEGIAPGQKIDFVYDLNVPEEIEPKDYPGFMMIFCDEVNKSVGFRVTIPSGLRSITVNHILYDKEMLDISYNFDSSALKEDQVSIEIRIVDEDGNEVKKYVDSFARDKEIIEREILIEIGEGLSGIYSVYFALNSNPDDFLKQSVVLGKSTITGLSVFDDSLGKVVIYVIFILVVVCGIIFIIWNSSRKENKNKRSLRKKR